MIYENRLNKAGKIIYSVVTDLARLRGKSTSTPLIMARSAGSEMLILAACMDIDGENSR